MLRPLTDDEQAIAARIEALAIDWLAQHGFWLDGWSLTILDGSYHVLFEVKGPRLFASSDLHGLKEALARDVNAPLSPSLILIGE